jgi:Flp pilus assembly pilin Flp
LFLALQVKALDLLSRLHRSERGQTATEYVAVLVVAVGLAIGVLWLVLSEVLGDVISDVGSNLSSFSDSVFS